MSAWSSSVNIDVVTVAATSIKAGRENREKVSGMITKRLTYNKMADDQAGSIGSVGMEVSTKAAEDH